MSFNDIFKSSFLESVSTFSVLDTVIGLGVSLLIGLFIFLIYQKTLTGVLYSGSFALTLVGALSIVRFRTAIKEPVEIVFLFWSLAVGIVVGAGLIPLAVIGSAIIGVILLLFANRKVQSSPYILVMHCQDQAAETAAMELLQKSTRHTVVKAKTVNDTGIELTAELRTRENATDFVNQISRLTGVSHATLVSYSGEYLS